MESEDDGCYVVIVSASKDLPEEGLYNLQNKLFPLLKKHRDIQEDGEIDLAHDDSDWVISQSDSENLESYEYESQNSEDNLKDYRKDNIGNQDEAIEKNKFEPRGELKESVEAFIEALLKEDEKNPPLIPSDAYKAIDDNEYKCSYCSYTGKRLTQATKHYRFKHGPKYNKCLACHKSFRRRDSLLFHESYCQAPLANLLRIAREEVLKCKAIKPKKKTMKVPCVLCKRLVGYKNMGAHMKVHSDEKRFHCDKCPAKYRSKRSMAAHLNVHMGKRPHECHHCSKSYTSYIELQKHKVVHGDRDFKCDMCDRVFRRKHSLQIHMETHAESGEFLCPLCGKKFTNSQYLNKHVKNHDESTVFECTDCGKQYKALGNLNYHLQRHHKKKMITRKTFFNRLPKLMNSDTQTRKVAESTADPDETAKVGDQRS